MSSCAQNPRHQERFRRNPHHRRGLRYGRRFVLSAGIMVEGCPSMKPFPTRPHDFVHTAAAAFYPDARPLVWHKRISGLTLAERIARLKGLPFAGTFDSKSVYGGKVYLVPEPTLVGPAGRFGIGEEGDLFGGLVPHPFMATKAITHPLFRRDGGPDGWVDGFPAAVAEVVLDGWTAFDPQAALEAGRDLLAGGPVRLKLAGEDGGHGQAMARDEAGLRAALERMAEGIAGGMVLERHLDDITTYSIGRVMVGEHRVAYCGTQAAVPDNEGRDAYGGSRLYVVRGGFDELMAAPIAQDVRRAVEQARVYDAAADRHFPGFLASRRNYDVIAGRDAAGTRRFGVLEQSWRLGGASPAEIVALEAFAADPALWAVEAQCVEAYGPDVTVPEGAVLSFSGEDPQVGALTKYARIEALHHAF